MFQVGNQVLWEHTVGGWQWVVRTPATVVKVTVKRVVIEVVKTDGKVVQRTVKPEKLTKLSEG